MNAYLVHYGMSGKEICRSQRNLAKFIEALLGNDERVNLTVERTNAPRRKRNPSAK